MDMKTLRNISFLFLLAVAATSCNKGLLDPTNPEAITSADVWKDAKLTESYVSGLYEDVPGWDYNLYNNITDEARSNYPGHTPNQVVIGDWDATSDPMDNWDATYKSIRKINELLAQVDQTPLSAERKESVKAEAYFLRALHYFNLVKRYGGVPLLDKAQAVEDELLVSRSTLEASFSFIETELEKAYAGLPETAVGGKASRWTAKALLGRSLLYQASPLYNVNNDRELWKKSADASLAVITAKKYSLYPNLKTLWLTPGTNQESLFEVQYKMPEKHHGWDALVKPLRLANADAGQCSPVQELVNAFPMSNGKLITEAGSGYDPKHPYEGRDDRFYSFIAYNGAKMKGTTSGPPLQEITLEIYKGGVDYDANPANVIYNTITGYYTVKAVNPENTIYTYAYSSTQPWIELRYAEVLLNYAEAQNEYLSAPDASIYDAVNEIRSRAGITQAIPAGSLSKEQMRTLIHNERYIELCFENKRYWDLRRWKQAVSRLDGKSATGVIITKNTDGSFSYNYQPIDPNPPVFTEKMYFLPIPFAETTKNPNLLPNNPGW